MAGKIYGYARVSTPKQSIDRQLSNIKNSYPDAIIYQEAYTGTKMDRPAWTRLMGRVKAGDTIVFDEVSRMSRDAEEGFKVYEELYEKGVNLIFLKESTLNTDNFRKTTQIAMTGSDVDVILEGVNKYLMILAENQIKAAFATAQHEVDFLHKRTSEGVRKAIERWEMEEALGKEHEKERPGLAQGTKLTTKKSVEMKSKIRVMAKDFDGSMKDKEVMKILGIARNTYYKYKKEMQEEQTA